MALTWKNGVQPPVITTISGVVMTLYPAFNVITGLPSTNEVEVRRAPDNAGVPSTPTTIARLPPLPARGYVFVDHLPLTTLVWWYSHRHVQADGAIGGAWSAWQAATVQVITPGDQRLIVPPSANAGAVNTSTRYRASVYNSVAQSIGAGATAVIAFTGSFFDIGKLHDNVTNNSRVTIPAINNLGIWVLRGQVAWSAGGAGGKQVGLLKDGAPFPSFPIYPGLGTGVAETQVDIKFDVDPAAGDYWELQVVNGTAGAINVMAVLDIIHQW